MTARRPLAERVAGHYEREARRAEAAAKRARRDRDEAGAVAWAAYAARVRACGGVAA